MGYRIEYDPAVKRHLEYLNKHEHAFVLDIIDQQLSAEPVKATRNRKRMRPNPVAPWVLRFGRVRVYFTVVEEPEKVVVIRAVGLKDRSRVWIGGTEVKL